MSEIRQLTLKLLRNHHVGQTGQDMRSDAILQRDDLAEPWPRISTSQDHCRGRTLDAGGRPLVAAGRLLTGDAVPQAALSQLEAARASRPLHLEGPPWGKQEGSSPVGERIYVGEQTNTACRLPSTPTRLSYPPPPHVPRPKHYSCHEEKRSFRLALTSVPMNSASVALLPANCAAIESGA